MADRYWVGAPGDAWDGSAGTKWATTSGGAGGAAVPTSVDDVYFDSNSGAVNVRLGLNGGFLECRNLNCTGFTGVFRADANLSVYKDLTLGATMGTNPVSARPFCSTGTGSLFFAGTDTGLITSNGIPFSWDGFNQGVFVGSAAGGLKTVRLVDNLTTITEFQVLNTGTLDLNNNRFIVSANTDARLTVVNAATIAFGASGAIVIKKSEAVGATGFRFLSPNNHSFTGSKNIIIDIPSSFFRISSFPSVTTQTYAFNYISASTNAGRFNFILANDIDWSLGTGSLQVETTDAYIQGSFTTYIGMPAITKVPSGTCRVNFAASSGTKTLNCPSTWDGITLSFTTSNPGFSVVYNLASDIVQTNDTFSTVTWSTSFDSVTFNTNNYNITTTSFSASNRGTINLGSSTINSFSNISNSLLVSFATNIILNAGTSTIRAIGGSGQLIAANKTLYNVELATGSTITIPASSPNTTINTLSNTVSPAAITFPSSATTFVNNFNLSGTAGNLVTIRSTTAGTQATLSKASGTVTVTYVDLQDSNAIGGAVWDARGPTNVIGNNVTGWLVSIQFATITEAIRFADATAGLKTTNVNITEILGAADTANGIRIFNVTSNEAITSGDTDAGVIVTFVTAISEGLTVADTPTGFGIYPISISENITLADIEAAVKIHNATAAEPISVLDVTSCFGFGTIDNSQSTTWVLVDNRQ